MSTSIILAFLFKFKVELISTGLLLFQGWLGKTDKIAACNYLDLAIVALTYVRDLFGKKETKLK